MQLFIVATTVPTVSTLHESLRLLFEDGVAIARSFRERLSGVLNFVPSGNYFRDVDLFIRRSLGLRIEFPLFLLVLYVGLETNKVQGISILPDLKMRVCF